MATISVTEARDDLGKLWEKAAQEPVTVLNAGKPIAVVLSPDEYDKMMTRRKPRRAGAGRHLFAGVDVNALLAVDVTDAFAEALS